MVVRRFLTGFADSYWALFACRMLLGIFEAGNWPYGIRTTRQAIPVDERALGNSVFQSGTGLGAIVTPSVIAVALATTGAGESHPWQMPFRLIADIGSWTAGLAVVALVKLGWPLHRARLWTFACGVACILPAAAIPFAAKTWLTAILVVTAFGALGIFATYFTLSQGISGRNQGKITGILVLINSLYLAGLYWLQGGLGQVLALAPIPAMLALAAVGLFWPKAAIQE